MAAYCIELFRVPPSLALSALPTGEKRAEAKKNANQALVDSYIVKHDGPFPKNSLVEPARMNWKEEAVVAVVLFVILGGPMYWILLGGLVSLYGSWGHLAMYACVTLVLAFHPLPDIKEWTWKSYLVHSMYKYFSYRMVWSGDQREISRKNQFIGAGVPHGAMPFANLLSIPAVNGYLYTDRLFIGHAASVVLHTPFLRYFLLLGGKDCGRETIKIELKKGNDAGLVADGIAGIFKCSNQDEVVALKHRKGLAKLALRTGVSILPCYSLGNTQAFNVWFDPFGVMEWLSRKAQASLFLFWGRAFSPVPKRVPITMIIGDLIPVAKVEHPTAQQVDQLHERVLAGIEKAFNDNKDALGWGHKTIKFV